jgi:CRP-like cAMP-binding protein
MTSHSETVSTLPRNRLLSSVLVDDPDLLSELDLVQLEIKQIVFDLDQPIEYAYFPEDCVVSILGIMADGSAVETATVGHEGMLGLPLFHGTDRTSLQAFCQVSGSAYRMPAGAFKEHAARGGALTTMLHRYSQALFTLVAQSSACNRMHSMTHRCSRWLLHTHDRVGTDTFGLTHQFLSQMLGVRRATVTEALQKLQGAGAITYSMGHMTVLDRRALEDQSCECYAIIQREFTRLLGAPASDGRALANPHEGLRTSMGGRSAVAEDLNPESHLG